MGFYEVTLMLYNFTLLPIIFFSVLFIFLSVVYFFTVPKTIRTTTEYPFVTVQIPTYNDPIAERCVQKCLEFEYPKNRYEILIVDDSSCSATRQALEKLAQKNPQQVQHIVRDNREGYKPGALKNALQFSKGEIIVIFDSDWIPQKDFLQKVVEPFSDPKVALVQTRQGYYNHTTNIISRFAAYTLMIYHTLVMPINNHLNCVFFCGTAGALRRSALEEVGGWNLKSVTEDADISIKLLLEGYRTVYLEMETPSEVPVTWEAYLKQQMRWCYGNARVFCDHARNIFFKSKLDLGQRAMITYITLGNIIAPLVVLMTLFGMSGWFLGDPTLFKITDMYTLLSRFAFTSGFLCMGFLSLQKNKKLYEFKYLIFTGFTLGLVLAVANSYALTKAFTNKKLSWYCTPKAHNSATKQ